MYVQTYRGMGDAATAARNVSAIGSSATSAATSVLGMLTAGGGTVLGITAAAVPVIGAALMGATLLVQHLVANSGCGQTCIVTSQWANQAADALQQVMDGYFALPEPRTKTQQAVAIANFNTIWKQLKEMCGQPNTGDAGRRCISDRESGACVWRQKYAPVYPGQPEIGECWNWFNGYLKPIQQDRVVDEPTVSGEIGAALGGESNLLPLAVVGGLLLLAATA